MTTTTPGAPAALHGYRVQALYTLKRILTQADNGFIFHPENQEDLDVLDEKGQTLELIQVKKYSPLQLSDLEPSKSQSFFRRALEAIKSSKPPSIKLVNFGEIGSELSKAWKIDDDKPTEEDKNKRTIVKKKFKKHGYDDSDIDLLLGKVEIIEVDENDEESQVYSLLSNLHTGIDPSKAFDLLHYWIFIAMENQSQITYSDVVEVLNSVGRWQAERRDYHEQWFTTIQPIEVSKGVAEDYDTLKQEFYEGGFTKYSHIVANLDFSRNDKEQQIKYAFQKSNIVIVHAASGQGKTTLALRYLHNHYPVGWRFSIARIENVQHALSVANALNGFATAIKAPIAVYLDVNPNDKDWIEFARQLAKHRFLQILITIREEDFRRANTFFVDFDYEQIDLQFNENEAQQIFDRAQNNLTQKNFLNFSEAWDKFGEGPLLEFVYLLTQTETLQQRLESQIARIENEVREKNLDTNEFYLLRLVAVATAFEARINTQLLIKSLKLRAPATTLNYYEDEYLIRISEKGYLEGLHAIRSRILVDLLTNKDFDLWIDIAVEVLHYLEEEDLEQFILNAAIERPSEFGQLHQAIINLKPKTWRGIAGILRSLLWVEIKQYVNANKQVIEEAKTEFGSGWYFIANLSLTNEDTPEIGKWWESDGLSSLFSAEKRERFNKIQSKQPPKDKIFDRTKSWLEHLTLSLDAPGNIKDWIGVSFVLYWAAFLEIKNLLAPIPDYTLPLFVLADVVYAFYKYAQSQYSAWLGENETNLLTRLANEMQVICIDKKEQTLLTTHFLVVDDEIEKRQSKDPFHSAASERLQLIRQLYPNYEKYGIQGYTHKLGDILKINIDSTRKSEVDRRNLAPGLATWANGVIMGFAHFRSRLEDWQAYVNAVLNRREAILICLEQLHQGLLTYISHRQPVNIGSEFIQKDDWSLCLDLLNDKLDFPKSAIDPRNFVSAPHEKKGDFQIQLQQTEKAQQEYFSHFRNFIIQAADVTATNFNLVKLEDKLERKEVEQKLKQLGINTGRAHLCSHNFWDAKQKLFEYQPRFNQLFGQIAGERLLKIQEREQILIPPTWLLWHHYAYTPNQTRKDPAIRVIKHAKKEKSVIDRWINGVLSGFSNQEQNAKRLPTSLNWKREPTLAIQLDVTNPTSLYDAFSELMEKLNLQFRSLKYEDLKHYLFQENYRNIIVIPTFRNQMANENAWTLYALSTILNKTPMEEQNWVSYQMQPLTQEWIDVADLKFWEHPQVNIANEISAAVSGLMILASQVGELAALPEEINEPGMELLQSYTSERSNILSDLLQQFIDHGTTIQDELNELPEAQIENRPHLVDAVSLYHKIFKFVIPSNSQSDEHHLGLEMMNEYAERLGHIALDAEYLRLLLIEDALDN